MATSSSSTVSASLNVTRNRGLNESAIIHNEQTRFAIHDALLQHTLNEEYEYITQQIDPILNRAIEQVLLYQPDQTADFLACYLRNTLEPSNYNYLPWKRQQYYERRVRSLLSAAILCALKERPIQLEEYFAQFFEERSK